MTTATRNTAVARAILERSCLSQSELGRRSGVAQSRISDYVTGRHVPSVGQLERLAEAAGLEVELRLRPAAYIPTDAEVVRAVQASMSLEGKPVEADDLADALRR